MKDQTNIKQFVIRAYMVTAFLLSFSLSYGQDIILFDQDDVDNFFPGSTYTGNITIGKSSGGGSPVEVTNLFNLSVLETLNGSLKISANADLANLDDLFNLTTINGNLTISNNPKMIDIDGLSSLEYVQFDVLIEGNTLLENLNGLDNVTTIAGTLYISLNNSLTEIDNFSNLTEVNTIEIVTNLSIASINGFQNLDSAFSIIIRNSSLLKEVLGFSKVHSVAGFFYLSGNNALTNLDGFSNLTNVGFIELNVNNNLENLDAFENIESVANNLTIIGNGMLSDCCGIYDLLDDPQGIQGATIIFNNQTGCDSKEEVIEEYCRLIFDYNVNPSCINQNNGSIQINITNYDTIPFTYNWIRLEDGQTGNGISTQNFFAIDMLQAGTYDLTISTPRPDIATENNIVVPELNGSIFEVIQVNSTNSSNGLSNGSIELIVSGGSTPYEVNWSGPDNGSQAGIFSDTLKIPLIPAGEYTILVSDNMSIQQEIMITLLDDTVPVYPCSEPLDIVILNDVSGSVDATEYQESKAFFVDFVQAANIGMSNDESRAAIVEWSSGDQQEVKVAMTGNINTLNDYQFANRSFDEGTAILEAMQYGEDYLNNQGRPNAEKVIIIATDATIGQAPGSLVAFADQLKAKGFNILTIAFDNAYADIATREILFNMASIGALAPGAPAYSLLDQDLAENIVNIYLCPIDPGESSNVYFNRDGAIQIDELLPDGGCPNPAYVSVNFTVEAFKELSIPGGTNVTFYLNDPNQYGATKIYTWQIPCSIPAGSSENYTVTLPINGPSHIFAVLNDNGESGIPIDFPITDLEETAYSNNIDDEWLCLGDFPTIQVLKYTTTPTPSCDSIVNYTINVCNISDADAFGVQITDQPPAEFTLINTVANLNDCTIDNNGSYDIPAGCCFSLFLSYDASGAPWGYYGDQDVLISGPPDQEYFGFDGSNTTAEDVILDGTIDCPSTIVEFTKEVNRTESCDDAFLTYTFTINNELNFPLQGLTFVDIVPLPSTWVFEPYNISGLSIGIKSITENSAQFIIDEVQANTVASFSFDLSLGFWEAAGTVLNSAQLGNVPDLENGGVKTLISNSTSTDITPTTPPELPDTIYVQVSSDTLIFEIPLDGQGTPLWTSEGDGTFLSYSNPVFRYILGENDKENGYVTFLLDYMTECFEMNDEVVVILQECSIELTDFQVNECDNNATPGDPSDDTYTIDFTVLAMNQGSSLLFELIIGNDTIGSFTYNTPHFIPLPADGMVQNLIFVDQENENCMVTESVSVENCSDPCSLLLEQFLISDCDDNDTPNDNTDDSFVINFILGAEFPGLDSTYLVIIGNDTTSGYNYYDMHSITVSASNNISDIQFIDSENLNCFLSINVGVESCIYPCELVMEEWDVSDCDNEGTVDDDSDDTFTVTFNLVGNYPGSDSTFYLIEGMDTLGIFSYNSAHTITLSANGSDHILDFFDTQLDECMITQIVNQASCSSPCMMEFNVFDISECDDNSTPEDFSDDFYNVVFNINSTNPGLDSMYWLIADNDTLGLYAYNSAYTLTFPAEGVDNFILFVDSQFPDCFLTETINVESCSDDCALILDQLVIKECNDNSTTSDNSDDFYEIEFEVTAVNPSLDSMFYLIIENDTIGTYAYGELHSITLPSSLDTYSLIFVDTEFEDCLLNEMIELESCSDECQMIMTDFSVSQCMNQGTEDDETDDTFEVTFDVAGNNISSDSLFYLIIDQDTIGLYSYHENHTLSLLTQSNPYELTFIDSQSPDCFLIETLQVESCSLPCELWVDAFTITECDDNNTPNNSMDDTYFLTFSVSKEMGNEGSFYFVLLDGKYIDSFEYNTEISMQIPNSGGNSKLEFIDSELTYCWTSEVVDLMGCITQEDVVIPNVFSPNNDNINDEWTIRFFNGSQPIQCEMYDRWGNHIYSSRTGEDPVWDGSFNGKMVTTGVYVFYLTYDDGNGRVITKYGDVLVMF
ncbi:MAG: gliding motility-associated C-terminal domain-containing protein [Saprospiraceae bacterium]|nr:gliding motility-associated C-terminal domain-containing protein [Saprospiraceae bacterium]